MPVFEEYFKKYDVQMWEQAKEAKPSIKTGMTEEMSGLYDKIVQKANEGYHELRRYICIEQLKAFDQGPESEVIQMLDILESIIEGLIEEEKAIEGMSELGFYRPVAMAIEVLFRKSQFEMKDGETCSNATKTCRQLNEEICDDQVTNSTTIGRRIDLLMKVMNIELRSSEWKRPNVGKKLGESQQIKNIRTNTAILESIESMPLDDDQRSNVFVIGIDWLGDVGYMMAIKKVDSAYVAYHIGDLALPVSLSCLKDFKQTLNLLFSFKHHHFKLRRILAPSCRRQANNQILNMYRCGNAPAKRSSSPGTFFSPKKKQQKKRPAENPTKTITIESDEDDGTN